jgi:hypothetical protein
VHTWRVIVGTVPRDDGAIHINILDDRGHIHYRPIHNNHHHHTAEGS